MAVAGSDYVGIYTTCATTTDTNHNIYGYHNTHVSTPYTGTYMYPCTFSLMHAGSVTLNPRNLLI